VSAAYIGPDALLDRIKSGTAPAILDVRSRKEFELGHVPGARHIPFWRVSRQIDDVFPDRDAELIVYCGHGPRALLAGRMLHRRGFARIVYLDGHFSKWRSAGFREERE
jgi:rhodanese-related sulfurtransferase